MKLLILLTTLLLGLAPDQQSQTKNNENELASLKAKVQMLKTIVEKQRRTIQELKDENKKLKREIRILNPKPVGIPAKMRTQQGGAQIWVRSAHSGTVPIIDGFDGSIGTSKNRLLSIIIAIRNTSKNQKLNYETWAGSDFSIKRDYGTLRDNFGNSYKRITFGLDNPKGRIDNESIYPQRGVCDILIFEKPINRIDYLDLELPAGNFGGTGMLRFRIPAMKIKMSNDPLEP